MMMDRRQPRRWLRRTGRWSQRTPPPPTVAANEADAGDDANLGGGGGRTQRLQRQWTTTMGTVAIATNLDTDDRYKGPQNLGRSVQLGDKLVARSRSRLTPLSST
ncbi:Os03g0700301 [Oryza sativa Japonica Group]|uniref:Os03g0700301 protein n=1 Tax=Oryza sativa subsp. japonica TaxID=39947 RepID=A0A0N7KHW0_ORYSJ|nr:Os03g0700301 [Oryza sativa Japonica Group]